MKIFVLLAVLLVSNGLGASLPDFKDMDKRRESTPEILNLEQELKKAAGEDKQFFSANEARPVPQIDGLAEEDETEGMPVNQEDGIPPNEAALQPDDVMGGIPGYEEDSDSKSTGTYSQMWNMFRQHPDYFEDVLQDYMNNVIEDQEPSGEYQGIKRDSSGVFPYPADNERMSADDYPEQYVPSDDQDRSAALMADYFASVNQGLKYDKEDQVHGGDNRETDTDASVVYEPENEEHNEEDDDDQYEGSDEDESEDEEPRDSAEDDQGDEEEEDQSDEDLEHSEEEDGQNGKGTGELDDEAEDQLDSLHADKSGEVDDASDYMDHKGKAPHSGESGSPIKSKQAGKPWQDIGDVVVPPMPIM